MGKRSDFKRRPQDAYDTPASAATPLKSFVERGATYWEPCAGKGALAFSLMSIGLKCVEAIDIKPRASCVRPDDALTAAPPPNADLIITNPPWSRGVLHPMIERFSDALPTWLLFDADWVHTKQAVPYLPRLRKIVSVGRVKWIEDSPHTGKDNCAWHLFDKPSDTPARFYGRAA